MTVKQFLSNWPKTCFYRDQEGREIKPVNADDFAMKQDYIRKLTSITSLKAQEEEGTSINFVSLYFIPIPVSILLLKL